MRVRAATWFGVLALSLVLGCVLTTPAFAGERDDELALRAVQAQIEQLMQQARRLREAGDVEAAEGVQTRAKELRRKVAELTELRRRLPADREKQVEGKPEAKRRQAIARGLAQGIEALRALGRREEAAQLERILADVKGEDGAQAREHEKQVKREAEERQLKEMADLDSLAQRVKVMQLALSALREGERKDAVEILERAIHTGKILLAEREDEEARQIIERTPPLAQLAQVLGMASQIWLKFGHETKAKLVFSLAKRYAQQAQQAEREEEGEENEKEDAEEHEGREHVERAHGKREGRGEEKEEAEEHDEHGEREGRQGSDHAEALKRLHAEMQELRVALERMQRQLRELAR